MGCGCKKDNNFEIPGVKDVQTSKVNANMNTVVKWSIFITLAILSPIIAPPLVVWALYKGIIKNDRLDAILMFKAVSQAAKTVLEKEEDVEPMDEDDVMELISKAEIEELPIK